VAVGRSAIIFGIKQPTVPELFDPQDHGTTVLSNIWNYLPSDSVTLQKVQSLSSTAVRTIFPGRQKSCVR
jgi:hypothetical protein